MTTRTNGSRKLSFEILRANDDSFQHDEASLYRSTSDSDPFLHRRKQKNKRRRQKKTTTTVVESLTSSEDPTTVGTGASSVSDYWRHVSFNVRSVETDLGSGCMGCSAVLQSVVGCEEKTKAGEERGFGVGGLRQMSGNGSGGEGMEADGPGLRTTDTADSMDWKRLMEGGPPYIFTVDKSPLKYFMEEMYVGNSLRSTTTLGNEKERESVYDTIFHLPWRCELLIDVGFFLCLDSFLSMLTVMPTRIMMVIWRLVSTREFKRPSAAAMCDFGCFLVLACGVTLLEQTDISLIYHMIRGQGTIKLYVVYNVLEIFDKLFQNFGGDVLETLFNSAGGFASCPPENMRFWFWRFISDQALAVATSIVHSFILLAQAITLSTCIVAQNNALLALLVSNNFAEIKSNVFKRINMDNIQSLVHYDSVERFHILAFLLFVLAQNILEAEDPWFKSFIFLVFQSLRKFWREIIFIEDYVVVPAALLLYICFSLPTLNIETGKRNLTFVPLAPACVVIRVMTPIYGAHLPYGPLLWRLFWIIILSAMTYVMLVSLKVMIGMILRKHASWYIIRCRKRKLHSN